MTQYNKYNRMISTRTTKKKFKIKSENTEGQGTLYEKQTLD